MKFSAIITAKVKSGSGVDLLLADKVVHYSRQDVEKQLFNHFKITE